MSVGSGTGVSVGSVATALTSGAGVSVGSRAVVAAGAVVAVGGTAVGFAVTVGTGVGVSASHANTSNIEDTATTAMLAMLIERFLRVFDPESFIGLCPR